VVSLDTQSGGDKSDKNEGDADIVINLAQIDASNDLGQIDTGVTSGADQSSWDPIEVDDNGRGDECAGSGGNESSSSQSTPSACGVRQKPQ
jgi:hypothetical protein